MSKLSGSASRQQTWMTPAEAADYARVSVHTIRAAVRQGRLTFARTAPGTRGSLRFTSEDVDAWLNRGRPDRALPTPISRRRSA